MVNERQQRAARAEQMRKEREKAEKRQRNVITVGIVAVVIGLIAAAAWAVTAANEKREPNTKLIPPAGATKDFGVVYGPKDIGVKPKSDFVRVSIYEDMQCPICRAFEAATGQYLADAVKKGEIEVEYRFVAFLDDLGASPNEYSRRASNAVLCAREDGAKAFKLTHDVLYANQPEEKTLGPDDNALLKRVTSAGVPTAKAEACVLKHKYVPWIEAATKEMDKKKISGTPTVMIEGEQVQGPNGSMPTMADIQKAVDAAK